MAAEVTLDSRVVPGHTQSMKCAISVPDEVFAAVEEQAARLGISRSEFFAVAAARYVHDLTFDDRVAAINALVDEFGDEIAAEMADVVAAGRRFLATVEWNDDEPS